MAIDSFDNLKSAVRDWAERSDISDTRLEEFIYMAEADASQTLRVPAMEHQEELVVTDGRVTIPFDYLELRRLTWDKGQRDQVLEYLPWDQFVAYNRDSNGRVQPKHFSRQGSTWFVSGEPADSDTVLCHYYRFIPQLTASTQSNWLLAVSPQVYLFGSLKYLYEFTMNEEKAAYWEAKFVKEINKLQAIADTAEHRGTTLTVREIQ